MYQLFVGEIGFPRQEFLYELRWWEVNSIIRGYRKRNRLTHQLIAECVYATTFTMRDPKGTKVDDMFPSLFDDENDPTEAEVTDEEYEELQSLMSSINAGNASP